MLTFDQGENRFNFRVAGLAFRDGHMLVHRATHEHFWTFPGGRAEMGEETADTLRREMGEEIQCEIAVGRLLWVVENFFRYEGRDFHELGFYYIMKLETEFPFVPDEIVHRIVDGVNDTEFKWVEASPSTLAALPLYPEFIPEVIGDLPLETQHLVWRDRIPPQNQKPRG
ncbi:MAG: NUDIX hydrolase [Rhizobiaceae bacterium]